MGLHKSRAVYDVYTARLYCRTNKAAALPGYTRDIGVHRQTALHTHCPRTGGDTGVVDVHQYA